ncbi:MAG: LysM peptidoglycan-binding domain-containing protein [Acidimicrobiia bacterium]
MEPAIAFAVLVATTLALAEVSFLVGSAFRRLALTSFRSPAMRTLVPLACSMVLSLSAVRLPSASAATPPPSVRVVSTVTDGQIEPQEVVSQTQTNGGTYTVQRGDSLWRIAKGYLERSARDADGRSVTAMWKAIYELNRSLIGDDPNLILPGQVLLIPGV